MLTAILAALAVLTHLYRTASASHPVARLCAHAVDEVSVRTPQTTLRAPPKLSGTEFARHGLRTRADAATTALPLPTASSDVAPQ